MKLYNPEIWDNNDPTYGDMSDFDATGYHNQQLWIICLGRGDIFYWGNVDDLDPKKYNHKQMEKISKGRGIHPHYGNIDDLDPSVYDYSMMSWVAFGRGSQKAYANIDDLDPVKDGLNQYDLWEQSVERAEKIRKTNNPEGTEVEWFD